MTHHRTALQAFGLFFHSVAVAALGLMAGFFWTYSANVNLAMLQMDGATYATIQSAFNRHVRHALFFVFFFGPPVACAAALACDWPGSRRGPFAALAAAGLLYLLGIVVFTAQVHLPLNAYTESWDPNALPQDWRQVRARWNAANLWRTWASALAFVLATGALAWRALPSQARMRPAAAGAGARES